MVGVCEFPVGEKLVDDGEVFAGLREAREELLNAALALFLLRRVKSQPDLRQQSSAGGRCWRGRVRG
jgi:hypothetical protein